MISRTRALAALLTAACASPALAGAVVIWPVDPTIGPGERAAALWVENQGLEPMSVQIRALGWRQEQGDEALVEQDEVIASPPMASVPPGARQLVRVIRRTPAQGEFEQSYRLLIDELPSPAAPGAPGAASAALSVQMRYSVPLFTYAAAAEAEAPALRARLIDEQGGRFIKVANAGRKHARLVDLRTVAAGETRVLLGGLVGYVLPGRTMRWPLPDVAPGELFVTVNGAELRLVPGV